MKPFILELKNRNLLQVFASLQHLPYSLLFDSADQNHQDSRYSFVVSHPIETIEAKNGDITITNWDGVLKAEGNPFDIIAERMKTWREETDTVRGLPPFQGGAAGLFGYDLGRSLETLPESADDNESIPDLAVGIYDQVIAFDHEKNQSWIITHAPGYEEARRKQNYLLELISNPPPLEKQAPVNLRWQSNFSAFEYKQHIQKVIDYIKAGDIFQANLAQRFDATLPEDFDPFGHYLRLRTANPAPFAGFMNFGAMQIASASPERFLTCKHGHVQTRPIKGTRPHFSDIKEDLLSRKALEDSEKDHAENTMIVDLLRNDLSKVCKAKSVEVAELCAVETFASVHHLVSTIKGELKKGKTPIDLLKACFPGGSITGAPKIRAMEIIEELEPTRRGPYCGAMGYIGFDGAMDTNILIRTLVFEDRMIGGPRVSLQSGGGIVADSNPDAEYQETLDKAQAMFTSFEDDAPEDAAKPHSMAS